MSQINLELVDYNDPILKRETQPFDFDNPPYDPEELVQSMVKVMRENNGVGLAAPQVGIPYSVFIMTGNPTLEIPNYAVFNPNIVNFSDEKINMEEGCLSFPHTIVKVKRAIAIRCRFKTHTGNVVTQRFTGLTSRIFQHEFDHLEGTTFFDRANYYHREKALKKLKINKRRNRLYKFDSNKMPMDEQTFGALDHIGE